MLAARSNQGNNYQNTNQTNPNRSNNQKYYQNKPQYNKYNNNPNNNYQTEHENRTDFDYDNNSSRRTNDDYERKRRLALESAPWNDYSNQDYDNQRPYSKGNYSSGRSYSKNYDTYPATAVSNTKYTQPESFHSDRSSSSFSDFSSEKSFKETSPPVEKRSKYDNYEMDTHINSSHSRNHQYSKKDNRDYKWKNDDNGSTSSYFTESESLDGVDRKYAKRRTARSPVSGSSLRKRSRSPSKRKESYYNYSRENSKTLDREYSTKATKSSHSNNSSNSHNRSVEEKKPIKMTFLRKQQSLKNVKLANSKDEFESDEMENNSDDRNGSPYNKDVLEPKMVETSSSREELLKRLKEIDEAISR